MTSIMKPMRVSRDRFAAHRQGILAAAGRLFRARGVEGVSVAEVMREAGMTHGGFYGHYASKTELAASACRHALAEGAAHWRRRAARARAEGADPVAAIAAAYLSMRHVNTPEQGCAIPSLAAEAARTGAPLRAALSDGVRELLAALAAELPGDSEAAKQDAALGLMAAMVGGLVLARASDDPVLAERTLAAARRVVARAREPAGKETRTC